MKHKSLEYLYGSFTKLVEKYGFVKSAELNEEGEYWIEYSSDIFVIRLVKYFRSINPELYKIGYPDRGVGLFNLLRYLDRASSDVPAYKSFEEEKDLSECYKKQFHYIADTIDDNFVAINEFFQSGDYELKMADIRQFMLTTYPNLFKSD